MEIQFIRINNTGKGIVFEKNKDIIYKCGMTEIEIRHLNADVT